MFRALVLAVALVALAGCDSGPRFKSTDLTGAPYGRTLSLTGHDGKPRTLPDFRGKVVVVLFGYAQCPDICPTTLAEAARVIQALGKDAERVQVVFVTLDPERDTPQVLAQYVPAFHPTFLGLRGSLDETRQVAGEFKVFFEKREGSTPGSYSIEHSAQCYVIDTQGRLRLFARHDRLFDFLPDDIRVLLRESA